MLDVALVHIAVHDAVQAIEKRYEPYHFEIARAKGSRSAAAAAAAHGVLTAIYPAQATTLNATYYNYLADHGLSGDPGWKSVKKLREHCAAAPRDAEPGSAAVRRRPEIGVWRPTESFIGTPPAPPSFSPMVTPWLAETVPFTLTSPARSAPRRRPR